MAPIIEGEEKTKLKRGTKRPEKINRTGIAASS
jgi:hypothetical protein